MGIFSFVIALIKTWMEGSGLEGYGWWDLFFDNLVVAEKVSLSLSWAIWVGFLLALIILWRRGTLGLVLEGCGCFVFLLAPLGLVIALLPLASWFTLQLAESMATAVEPEGIEQMGRFILTLIAYLLLFLA